MAFILFDICVPVEPFLPFTMHTIHECDGRVTNVNSFEVNTKKNAETGSILSVLRYGPAARATAQKMESYSNLAFYKSSSKKPLVGLNGLEPSTFTMST